MSFTLLRTKEWATIGIVEPQFYALPLEEKLARSSTDYQRNDHAAQRQKP
jgi:hypothetical protein